MTKKLSAIIGFLLVCACGAASASSPDSANPAHCVAAFHYGRTLAMRGKPVDLTLVVESTARAIYEGRKLKAADGLKGGERDGEALLASHAGEGPVMMTLLEDCMRRQEADPAFHALNDSGALMAAARKVDPACQADVACRSRGQ